MELSSLLSVLALACITTRGHRSVFQGCAKVSLE